MWRMMLAFAVAGLAVSAVLGSLAGAAGFAIGAAFSILSFRWLKQLVHALGGGGKKKPSARFAVLMGLRYLLVGVAAYVIVKFFGIHALAILAGLFVAAAAAVGEALYQLIYART
jgi:hypothetical protein